MRMRSSMLYHLLTAFFLINHVCFELCTCQPANAIQAIMPESLIKFAASLEKFVDEVPLLPTIKGYVMHDGAPQPANLTIGMYQTKWQFHKDLPPTTVYAFGTSQQLASVPGPTIEAVAGVDTYVKWENHLPATHMFTMDFTLSVPKPQSGIPTVVHLHGGMNDPTNDGHGNSWFTSNFTEKGPAWIQEVYHYYNPKHAGAFWYHDHTPAYTRLNILAGLFGAYVIRDPATEAAFSLPTGPEVDRFLLVFDRSFNPDGSLYSNSTGNNPNIHPQWQPEFSGTAIVVNGKAWPFMKVYRRKYRFRIINTSNSRYFQFALDNGLSFTHIGSDSFYLSKPEVREDFVLSPAEIADVVIDFSKSKTSEIIMTNSAPFPYPGGEAVDGSTGKIMKFIVENEEGGHDHSKIQERLVPMRKLHTNEIAKARYITLFEYESPTNQSTHMEINFLPYDAPVSETPKEGTTELWHIINLTKDDHPMHLHLVAFQVLSQQQLNVTTPHLKDCVEQKKDPKACNLWNYKVGKPEKPMRHESGWKNVYKVKPGYVASFLIRFSQIDFTPFPFDPTIEPGYVYHCHILEHEDNTMMRPFKIQR